MSKTISQVRIMLTELKRIDFEDEEHECTAYKLPNMIRIDVKLK